MGPPEGKILAFDTVSQNRLNTLKIIKINVNFQKLVLGF